MSPPVSLWLEPSGATAARLRAIIADLAAQHQLDVFEPHVTLLPFVTDLPLPEVARRCAAVAAKLARQPPLRVRLASVTSSEEHFQCVFALVDPTPAVMAANVVARQVFGRDRDPPYMPHLSLAYGAPQELRAALAAGVEGWECEFAVEAITVWSTPPAGTDSWACVARVPLPPPCAAEYVCTRRFTVLRGPRPAPVVAPRTMVTGFLDWKLPENDEWRLVDNPSGKLLLGARAPDHGAEQDEVPGELPRALAAGAFRVLPVVWGAQGLLVSDFDDLDVDVVVHIGLGNPGGDSLVLEGAAGNRRVGCDALGADGGGAPVEDGQPDILLPPNARVRAALAAAAARPRVGAYDLVVTEPPPAGSGEAPKVGHFLCNETLFRSWRAVQQGQLQAAFFLHMPYPRDNDYRALAEAVAEVVGLVSA